MKSLIAVLILLFATTSVSAVTLRPGHPNEVIVTKGDTLWDISGRFLQNPWEWPKLWRANPQVKNPHLIYPGDRLRLKWVNGQPTLVHSRGKRTGSAIPTVDYSHLEKFLMRPYLLDKSDIETSGYLVAFGDQRLLATRGFTAYARKLDPSMSDYIIVRPGDKPYRDHETDRPIGIPALYVGTVKVKQHGDPSVLVITDIAREAREGDRLIPATHDEEHLHHHPSVPARSVRGHIIGVAGHLLASGRWQTVAIDRGANDGLQPGNVLKVNSSAYEKTDWKRVPLDENRNTEFDNEWARYDVKREKYWYDVEQRDPVIIPEEPAGEIIVFRVYDDISFGLISDSPRHLKVGYPVHSPMVGPDRN
ncbi:MAG: LysM peptidoglycan-binding domain-containing protein [Chromatiales bacterium]|jgi:hypothetical protein